MSDHPRSHQPEPRRWPTSTCSAPTGRCGRAAPARTRRSTRARFDALGAEAGSAEMQAHARLANAHPPVLHTHDRFGHRIDQVEFHPSYHALMAQRAAPRPARHAVVARARAATSSAPRPSCSSPRPSPRCCARCR